MQTVIENYLLTLQQQRQQHQKYNNPQQQQHYPHNDQQQHHQQQKQQEQQQNFTLDPSAVWMCVCVYVSLCVSLTPSQREIEWKSVCASVYVSSSVYVCVRVFEYACVHARVSSIIPCVKASMENDAHIPRKYELDAKNTSA